MSECLFCSRPSELFPKKHVRDDERCRERESQRGGGGLKKEKNQGTFESHRAGPSAFSGGGDNLLPFQSCVASVDGKCLKKQQVGFDKK